jgi:hypothetical protein
MKKLILSISILTALNSMAQIVTDTVSTGLNYTNQVWYSLLNDEVRSHPKDSWDLGIELSGFNSSILVNTQKPGTAVYLSPFKWNQWHEFDTAGYKSWAALHNSDTMWDIGALNKPGVYDTEDLGWGTYDNSTHVIGGTRLYLITLPGNKFIKLGVASLANGTYTITYSNTDKSDSTTFKIVKSNYPDRNFVYYNFVTKTIVDREPGFKTWDLTFTRYIYNNYPAGPGNFIQQPVTGLLQNKGVKVAEVRKTGIAATNSYEGRDFTSKMNEIGSDWKTYDLNTNTYSIKDSLVYFVQDLKKNIWKVVMTGFSGNGAGNYIFTKQKLGNLEVTSFNKDNHVSVYPNPATEGRNITLLTDFGKDINASKIRITDMNGQVVFEDNNPVNDGLGVIEIPFTFSKGVYFISIDTANGTLTRKLLSL